MLRTKYILLLGMLLPQLVFAFTWQDLWFNHDQQGARLLAKKKNKEAAKEFNNSDWKGVAYYRDGDYQHAYDEFKKDNSAQGLYNQGNALAYMQKYQEALDSYNKALKLQKDYPDATHNIEVVEKLLKEQQSDKNNQSKDNQSNKGNKSQEQGSDNKQADNSKQQKQQGNSKGQDQKQSKEQNQSDKQNGDKSQGQQSQEQGKSQEQKNQQASSNQGQGNQQEPNKQQSGSQAENNQKGQPQQPASQSSENSSKEQPNQAATSANELAAKKEEQKQAMANAATHKGNPTDKTSEFGSASTEMSRQQSYQDKQVKAVLSKIPDDPGGLLRNKFLRDYQRQQQGTNNE